MKSILFASYQAKIQMWEWGRERFLRRKWLMKSHNKPMLGILPLLDITLSVRASLFFFCPCLRYVCVLALFFVYRASLSIYREIPKKLYLILLSTDQIMEQFSSIFPPQLLISCWAVTHFSAFFSFLCSVAFF